MKKYIFIYFFFIFITFSMPSRADAESMIQGVGATICAEYLEKYRASPSFTKSGLLLWAVGYMSGLNAARMDNKLPGRNLAVLDMDSISLNVNIYCDKNSIFPVAFALDDIYARLPEFKSKGSE